MFDHKNSVSDANLFADPDPHPDPTFKRDADPIFSMQKSIMVFLRNDLCFHRCFNLS